MSGLLTHSVNDILRRLLVNAGKGTLPSAAGSWPIGIERPDSPDDCITLTETTGRRDGRTMTDGEVIEHLGVQIEVRAADHNTGFLKAKQLATYCDESIYNNGVTFESKIYNIINVSRVGGVMSIGRETPESARELFTFNVLVTIVQSN